MSSAQAGEAGRCSAWFGTGSSLAARESGIIRRHPAAASVRGQGEGTIGRRFAGAIDGLTFVRLSGMEFVGQWQDGDFYGIGPQQPGARRVVAPKPAWKAA